LKDIHGLTTMRKKKFLHISRQRLAKIGSQMLCLCNCQIM
jgi:hypothetical protein